MSHIKLYATTRSLIEGQVVEPSAADKLVLELPYDIMLHFTAVAFHIEQFTESESLPEAHAIRLCVARAFIDFMEERMNAASDKALEIFSDDEKFSKKAITEQIDFIKRGVKLESSMKSTPVLGLCLYLDVAAPD